MKRLSLPSLLLALLVSAFFVTIAQAQDDAGPPPLPDTTKVNMDKYATSTRDSSPPASGFDIIRTDRGSLNISVYGLFRYLNQLPGEQTFQDHLGRERTVKTRNDLNWHRTMVWLTGFFYDPKFRYNITLWSLPSTQQTLLFGNLRYLWKPEITFGVGLGPNLTNRSMQGSWPFWAGSDRLMAEEFLRGGFASSAWITGNPISRVLLHGLGEHEPEPAWRDRVERHARSRLQRQHLVAADHRRVRAARRVRRPRAPREARDPARHVRGDQPREPLRRARRSRRTRPRSGSRTASSRSRRTRSRRASRSTACATRTSRSTPGSRSRASRSRASTCSASSRTSRRRGPLPQSVIKDNGFYVEAMQMVVDEEAGPLRAGFLHRRRLQAEPVGGRRRPELLPVRAAQLAPQSPRDPRREEPGGIELRLLRGRHDGNDRLAQHRHPALGVGNEREARNGPARPAFLEARGAFVRLNDQLRERPELPAFPALRGLCHRGPPRWWTASLEE